MAGKGTAQNTGPRIICSLLFVLILVVAGAPLAQAEPAAITQAKSQAAALEAQVKALDAQAGKLVEKYSSAITQLTQTKTDAAEDAAQLAQAQDDQASAESALNARLAEIYKQGRSSGLDVLLTSTSWSDLLNRVALLQRISKQDADLVQRVTTYRAQVADKQAKLAALLEKQQAAADQVQAAGQAVTQELAQSKQRLKGKEAQIAQLEKEWQDQQATQARLQQEAQAKLDAALAAAQAEAQKHASNGSGQLNNGGSDSGGQPHNGGSDSGGQPHNGGSDSGGQAQHGASNILKPEQIALVAQKAGFSGENLVIAVAVAMAESNCNADAMGRLHTYGLWQILSHAHPNMIDPSNPEASRWFDPYVNATFAWKISKGGSTWAPWSVYTSGAYLGRMDKARAGVNLLLSNPSSVVPPTVK